MCDLVFSIWPSSCEHFVICRVSKRTDCIKMSPFSLGLCFSPRFWIPLHIIAKHIESRASSVVWAKVGGLDSAPCGLLLLHMASEWSLGLLVSTYTRLFWLKHTPLGLSIMLVSKSVLICHWQVQNASAWAAFLESVYYGIIYECVCQYLCVCLQRHFIKHLSKAWDSVSLIFPTFHIKKPFVTERIILW